MVATNAAPLPTEANTTSPNTSSRFTELRPDEVERTLTGAAATAATNASQASTFRPIIADTRYPMLRPCLTEDQILERDAKIAADRRYHRARELLSKAGVPIRYARADLDNVDAVPQAARGPYAKAVDKLKDAATKPVVIVLCGPRGPGKTHMACGLVRQFCKAGRPAVYAVTNDVFDAIKATYGNRELSEQRVESRFSSPALLVLDEFQERGATDWEDRKLTRLIDKRYADNKTTLLISNQTPKAFMAAAGDSIANRVLEGGIVIECTWPSLRPSIQPAPVFVGDAEMVTGARE